MTCTIQYDPGSGVVKATYLGGEDFVSLSSSVEETVLALINNHCTKLLCDLSKSTVRMSIVEMVQIEKSIHTALRSKSIHPISIKRAVVRKDNDGNLENYKFFENSSVNNLQMVKVFSLCEDALDWLNS